MRPDDQAALRPSMKLRHLPLRDVVTEAGQPVEIVYFPVTADLANVIRFSDGRSGMATNVGREGVSGLAAFLADEPCGWDIQVQIEGAAWALESRVLRRQIKASQPLLRLLLGLTHFNQIEAAQNAVCNTSHMIVPRIARWLLTLQDRTGGDAFAVTQEDVAVLVSARRTTVNAAWQSLRDAGAIRHSRGVITIIDRDRLQDQVCECYAALKWRSSTV
ncbi:Crp/Fnr family transcriptional regulator [Brevundimonas sp. NIBR11]|uniref:Crp/Fnr family transcriptional regulator n=1 Tax=Brevundimonas sp. NIBR11 TaxID=3015999 RepID=UPI0022F14008|nr:Crp/Fnr family transcriptional regulator [Brevundimonas sp. NIBR11]